MIDTASSVSILPASTQLKNQTQKKQTPHLFGANGSVISTFGTKHFTVQLSPTLRCPLVFVVADTTSAILGADFLTHFQLNVNLHKKIIYKQSETIQCSTGPMPNFFQIYFLQTSKGNNQFKQLLQEYEDLTLPRNHLNAAKHKTVHYIRTEGQPVWAPARRLPANKRIAAEDHFQELLKTSIITPSQSNFASPLIMVPKKGDTWRCCGDYRRLNQITIPDRYPLPILSTFTDRIAGSTRFTKIDLLSAYHQIPIAIKDQHKTAIITPFGLFEYRTMPVGL